MFDPPAFPRSDPPVVSVGHPDEGIHGVVDVVDRLLIEQLGLLEDVEHGRCVAPAKVAEVVVDIEVHVIGPSPLDSNSIGKICLK